MISDELQILLNANRVLASTLEIDQLLKVVLKFASEVVKSETGSLLLLDEKTQELVFDVALGEAGKELKTIRLKLGEGIAGWVAQENKPVIVNDPANDPRWTRRGDQKTKFVTRSILCVPLVHQGKLLGVVQTINKKSPDGFSSQDLLILQAFAAQTAVAIQNARLFSGLTQEKEKVETIFSEMTDGAVYSDSNGQCLLVNPAASRLLGIDPVHLSQFNLWEVLKTFSLNPSLDMLKLTSAHAVNFEAEKTEGVSVILTGLIKKIYSDKKEMIGVLTIVRDVTAAKKEEKLKRDFLSLMSHKLKTPLVAITGYTPMLLEDEDLVKNNVFAGKAIKSIHHQGLLLKQLVEKLISFSLIESDEVKVSKRNIQVKGFVESILSSMKTYLEDKNIVVDLDSSLESLPEVFLDYDKFKEIVKGLIENAAKFNKKIDKKIKISGFSDDSFFSFSVEDNGNGIPSHEIEKIFQKFYQIEESFTGQVEGAGLGLTLVKKLVEVQSGSIEVISKLEKGSTFTIRFPLKG